jgi:hypothetical protein
MQVELAVTRVLKRACLARAVRLDETQQQMAGNRRHQRDDELAVFIV